AHPDHVAICFNDIEMTYAELNARVNRFAAALQAAGVQKGDRIALLLVNSPTYVIAYFGILKIGAVVVNISVGIQGEELARCLKHAGARAVVSLDLFARNIYDVIARTDVETVILHSVFGLEKELALADNVPSPRIFLDFLAAAPGDGEPDATVSAGDVAVLQYTSGSTGAPKAATLTHGNVVASVWQSDVWVGIQGAGNAAVICMIPFFHVFGMSACLLISVLKGYRMVLLPRMDVMDILSLTQALQKHRPISFPAVPSIWGAILSTPDAEAKQHLASIQVASSGGAALSAALHQRFEALTGRRIMEAYGLSEAGSTTHITPYPHGGPPGAIGLPVPGTDARIMDLATGQQPCAVGEIGELTVRGPQIMQGYWNNPDLTARTLRHGWLYTGDLARMDADGFFYLVDRKDDLIISSGFNIYPSQIEEVLKRHPAVKDVAVIGASDRIKGQTVIAAVVLHEGAAGDRKALLAYCRENMPEYRVPKTILFRDAIPRDPAGKMLKRVLRQEQPQTPER
ncbi:MAG: AMP-binding protein, partial [Desulfatitalea sp.]|nr:AMP-binding protein [Desulfatitalea sp.]